MPPADDDTALDEIAVELYALSPDDFTAARNARAAASARELAGRVKALRKPTVAAWALNQLARRRGKDVERLVAAGQELRAAQEELLAGGDRKAFQSAAVKEREHVAKLAGEATKIVSEAGERASPALKEKISETLHAAALDEDTAEELRAGRLVREREAIGGFGGVMAAAPARGRGRKAAGDGATATGTIGGDTESGRRGAGGSARRGKAGADAGKRGKAAADGSKRGKAAADAGKRGKAAEDDDRRRADAERRDAAQRRQRLAGARTDERHAKRELDAAAKAAEHAETRAEAARVHAEEANARAKTTAERLKEARRERTAAKKAHARAERALAEAERGS